MVNLFNLKFPWIVFALLNVVSNVFALESKESTVESSEVSSDGNLESPDDSEQVTDDNLNHMDEYLNKQMTVEYLNDSNQDPANANRNFTNKSKTVKKSKKSKKNRKRKRKADQSHVPPDNENRILKYDIEPDVNISLDVSREVFSVNIDEDYVRDILSGNWITESDDGRKKKDKGGIMMKILSLFILPFLIQSSIMPFLVAKLKFLLIKSIIVGKLAIFLIVISAIKNSQKIATYESIPYYASEHPNRRSEAFTGYRVEGKPATWVN